MTNPRVSRRGPQQYQIIADHLRDAINEGRLSTGDELPSEAELCEQFGSSRGPVRQAMMLLRTEGLISTGRGRRSTVLSRSALDTFESTVSITAWLRRHGQRPGQRTLMLSRQPADATVSGQLNLAPGDHVILVHRVRYADDQPIAVERLHFPIDTGRHILALDTDTCSIHEELEKQGVVADNVSRWFTAISADEEEAALLDVPVGEPLLRITVTASDEYGKAFEFADYRLPARNYAMCVNSVRGTPSPASLSPVTETQQ